MVAKKEKELLGIMKDLKIKLLIENWRREMEAVVLYKALAQKETDPKRKMILSQLADIEEKHTKLWEQELKTLGYSLDQLPSISLPKSLKKEEMLQRVLDVEHSNASWYKSQRNLIEDENLVQILNEIEEDEANHEGTVESFTEKKTVVSQLLEKIWDEEKWHRRHTGGWVGDVIYGVNDGLGAIFGIIAGVAGYTNSNHMILVSGFFGALASTLSMGAGAWLATKSENEVMEKELDRERKEVLENPEHEREELALLYQLKGFTKEESETIANRISQNPDQFVKTMAQEELGIHETNEGNPWVSAFYGSISTFVGGIIPLIPFFFLSGLPAMIIAGVVSILAHFAVGAAKSLITARSWWASGLEMMTAGIIVGVISYVLGYLGTILL
ncbi:hypothetical protein DNHGIG_20720 [Collibacillus ludicampi]|uniref:Rubrerythrin diiron-binding domain-containing protein n=1 Tax=Collibacillus ludicampi TaxID=2771369 RepID=A0AAV4LFI5_9BACL|nr:VIT1/CCC1 transporter family protein [Collibacillus ludicampi]GIM46523.1 hypothetical protein DNHGIG_20720 [Collibacillus ludicampi]